MGLTRRRLLAMTGGGAAGLAGVSVPGYAATSFGDASRAGTVPFLGPHQAGVTTPPQERLMFAAFDLTITTAPELRELLRAWTHAAALMTAGRPVGSPAGAADVAPADTGEAVGLPPARLTLTFGLGPGVFLRDGHDRFGLAARRPQALAPIGPLPGDQLVAAASGGDLCVQACADDPLVAFHAVRDLARIGRGAVVMRWTQLGFGRAASTSKRQATPRNLQGFKDGTNNLETADAAEMRRFVWVGGDEPQPWMRGGTYVVTRRIRMLIEKWDGSPLSDQEETIGRSKLSGAPLGEHAEHDPVNLKARTPDGKLVIPADAHIREASHVTNGGVRILRRGYSFTDGIDPDTGQLDAGLFFICFQRDPHAQFAVLQRRLGASDALNEYIQHTSSAVFAVPTGVRPGGHIAEGLFEA
jgi:deferrochelatase/peroxidase EfeB